MIELTKKDITNLRLILDIISGHGKNLELFVKYWHGVDNPDPYIYNKPNIDISMFTNWLDDLLEKTGLFDSLDDYYNYFSVRYVFNTTNRELTISLYERTTTEDPHEYEYKLLTETNLDSEYIEKVIRDIEELPDDSQVTFNGGGDSGYISGETDDGVDLTSDVSDILYSFLEREVSGWEMDDGSSGIFTFNKEEKIINLGIILYYNELLEVDSIKIEIP
jgi:hypothetical protein